VFRQTRDDAEHDPDQYPAHPTTEATKTPQDGPLVRLIPATDIGNPAEGIAIGIGLAI
jgi:hypothetical protein